MNAALRASSRVIVLRQALQTSRTYLGTLVFGGAREAVRVGVGEALGTNLAVPAFTARCARADQGITEPALVLGGSKDAR